LCPAPPNGCRATRHPFWRRRIKEEEGLNGDQVVGRQGPAHHQTHPEEEEVGVVSTDGGATVQRQQR